MLSCNLNLQILNKKNISHNGFNDPHESEKAKMTIGDMQISQRQKFKNKINKKCTRAAYATIKVKKKTRLQATN